MKKSAQYSFITTILVVILVAAYFLFDPFSKWAKQENSLYFDPEGRQLVLDERIFVHPKVFSHIEDSTILKKPISATIYHIDGTIPRGNLLLKKVGNYGYFETEDNEVLSGFTYQEKTDELILNIYIHPLLRDEDLVAEINYAYLIALLTIAEIESIGQSPNASPSYTALVDFALEILDELYQEGRPYFITL